MKCGFVIRLQTEGHFVELSIQKINELLESMSLNDSVLRCLEGDNLMRMQSRYYGNRQALS